MFPVHNPVLIFAIVMLIVLIAPIISRFLKMPDIVGLLIAGTIFGSHILHILERDQAIELLGTIGLLYIMFQAGLEIDLQQVKKNKHYSLLYGFFTFIIPLVLGVIAGLYILGIENLAYSILLASMFSSHTLISYPIVSRLGITKHRAVNTTISGTIITDVLAMIILAIVIRMRVGEITYIFWLKFFLFCVVYVVLSFKFLPKLSTWFFRKFSTELGVEEYVFVLAMLFSSAFVSHLVGLEPIVGAFFTGIILNSLIPENSVLMHRIQFIGNALFIPFFLLSVGMIINPKLIFSDAHTIKVIVTMIIVAIISKYFAADIFVRIMKFSRNECNLMYGLSVNQAAATLAAILVSYKLGIFTEAYLTGAIIMILVTCLIGGYVTDWSARKIIIEEKNKFCFKEQKYLDRILVTLKNPNTMNNLVHFAMLLHKNNNESIYLANIVIDGPDVEQNLIKGENLLTKAVIRINSVKKNALPLTAIDINVKNALVKMIRENRITKVIFGWSSEKSSYQQLYKDEIKSYIIQSNEMIFFLRIVEQINLTKRIILIIPPLIHKQNGFIESLNELKALILAINAELLVICETENELLELINNIKPKMNAKFFKITSWKKIIDVLNEIVIPGDTIIQMIARQGKLAWRSSFDRMPENIAKKFKNNNFIMIYPYSNISEIEYEEIKKFEVPLLNFITRQNICFNYDKNDILELLNDLVLNIQIENKKELLRKLISAARDIPIELNEYIVLIHIHTNKIENFQIYIYTNQVGFDLSLDNVIKPKILIILLSPENVKAESHLNMLAEISKTVQIPKFTEVLLKSKNYDDFIERLNNK